MNAELSRRGFLQTAGAAATTVGLATAAAPAQAAGPQSRRGRHPVPPNRIGLQLYTVRDLLAADPEGTLEMVSDAGYSEIEPAYDYGGKTPAEFRALADLNGLRVIGSHHNPYDFRGDLKKTTLDRAVVLGQDYVGVSYMDGEQSTEGYRAMAAEMNQWGQEARSRGLRFYAHLHDNEFAVDEATGTRLFDVWLQETDPDLVWFEMDLYWILRAGVDPRPYLDDDESRFPLLHLKDGTPTQSIETDLGAGTVDFADILSHLRHLRSHHFVIERDQQPDPVRTVNVSYDFLRSLEIPTRR